MQNAMEGTARRCRQSERRVVPNHESTTYTWWKKEGGPGELSSEECLWGRRRMNQRPREQVAVPRREATNCFIATSFTVKNQCHDESGTAVRRELLKRQMPHTDVTRRW